MVGKMIFCPKCERLIGDGPYCQGCGLSREYLHKFSHSEEPQNTDEPIIAKDSKEEKKTNS